MVERREVAIERRAPGGEREALRESGRRSEESHDHLYGQGLRRETDAETDAARIRQRRAFHPLIVASRVSELGVDVRYLRPRVQVATDQRDARRRGVHLTGDPHRELVRDTKLA